MRVLLANEQRDVVGGMETYLRWLAPELLARGHQLVCVTRYPQTGRETWVPAGATAVVADSSAALADAAHGCSIGLLSPLGSVDLEDALARAIPSVLFAHTFYGTCVSGSKMHAFPTKRPCSRRMGLACLCLYGPRRCGGANPLTAVRLYARESARAALLPGFRRILVASRYMAHEYERHGVGPDIVQVVPYPVQRPVTAPAVRFRRRVVFIGRMTPVKGVDLLIDAIGSLSRRGERLELHFAGDGPVKAEVEARARRAGIAATFHGWLPQEQTTTLLREGGVLALPSTWPEPFGLVGLEATAQGIPVVAFDVGGIREWLVPGVNGEIAPAEPPTAEGLAAALERALDPGRWSSLSAGAFATAARFAPAAHLEAIEETLRNAS